MSNIVEFPERELSDEEWVRFFQKIEFGPATEADSATAFAFCKPPSPEAMCGDLMWARSAFGCLLMTKEQLTEYAANLLTLPDDELETFVQEIARCQRNFQRLARTMEAANARLCAAAHCAIAPERSGPGTGDATGAAS